MLMSMASIKLRASAGVGTGALPCFLTAWVTVAKKA
jgi:hypothetical protein